MSLLEVTGLCHMFGDKNLYQDAAFQLFAGEHMGVVGQNGTGKSTLIRLLTGELVPDAGDIRWQRDIHIGYLDQYAHVEERQTVLGYLQSAFSSLYRLEKECQGLYEAYAETMQEAFLEQAAEKQTKLEQQGFYQVDSEIAKAVHGLGLDAFGVDTPLGDLSGGQREKVILAKLLLEKADVLLLDEPTNFLDAEHVTWLAETLRSFPGAFIVVSHDFAFLEKVSGCILDIEFQTMRKYTGSYRDFIRQKAHLREDYLRRFAAQQKKIEETESYIRKNKAGVNSKMARGRQKQLDRLERLAPPSFTFSPTIRFSPLPLSSTKPLTLQELEVGYTQPLLPKLSVTVLQGQKLVLTGFNGIGKSTLLKTLVGRLQPLGGSFQFAEHVVTGYFEQELHWADPKMTPLHFLRESYPQMSEKELRKHLARCGLRADSVLQPVETLSGGEQAKVKLTQLVLAPVNFLLLDEPTNHLDDATKGELATALQEFPGSILLVSHEESFYRPWADTVMRLDG